MTECFPQEQPSAPKTWEETVAEIKKLSPIEQHCEIDLISMAWEFDADTYEYFAMLKPEFKFDRKEYFDDCRKKLMDAFGYAGYLTNWDKPLKIPREGENHG